MASEALSCSKLGSIVGAVSACVARAGGRGNGASRSGWAVGTRLANLSAFCADIGSFILGTTRAEPASSTEVLVVWLSAGISSRTSRACSTLQVLPGVSIFAVLAWLTIGDSVLEAVCTSGAG